MPPVRIADEDPDLFAGVADPAAAAAASVANAAWLETGPWQPEQQGSAPPGHFGLLILEGVMLRQVSLGVRDGVELLGPGDVARPWANFGGDSSISAGAHWHIHQRVRIADLDRRFAVRMAPWPEVAATLMDRVMRRQRFGALHAAIAQMPRLETRLRVLLWYLADRWGRVTADGIVLDVALTHELIAGIVGARRPGVTTALGELQRAGQLGRREDGRWLLRGEPPAELAREREEPQSGAA